MRMGAHTRRKADRNQPELVKFIRSMGASWQHTHAIPGALDGIIGYRGVDVRVEIKDPEKPLNKRALTEAESNTIAEWRGRSPKIIETEDDVRALLKAIAQENKEQ